MTFRNEIYDSILDTIGQTPLVRANRIKQKYDLKADIILKLEFFNPAASVKDRIAMAMIEAGEKMGTITQGTTIIEPTSGNTGIGLAMVCAAKGYKLILTMPESMSEERRKMLALFGAELVLTPADKGMKGAIDKAQELFDAAEHAFMPQQFNNDANPTIHYDTTGPEIWADTKGNIDVLIAGVGTGGTATGAGKFLKEKKSDLKLIVVEPEDSPVISGGEPGPHKIQGIGAGFMPGNLNTNLIDGIEKITNRDAFDMALEVARTEGMAVGISSGAAIKAAINVAKKPEMAGKQIVVIIPSFAERYLSTPLFKFYELDNA